LSLKIAPKKSNRSSIKSRKIGHSIDYSKLIMKTTVELPSGQIIDLSGFISLKPSTQNNYELILAGYDRPIDLSQSDAITLKQLLTNKSAPQQQGFPVYSESEQLQRNQIAMAKLQTIIDRDRQQIVGCVIEPVTHHF
jgi:hypothetical protein